MPIHRTDPCPPPTAFIRPHPTLGESCQRFRPCALTCHISSLPSATRGFGMAGASSFQSIPRLGCPRPKPFHHLRCPRSVRTRPCPGPDEARSRRAGQTAREDAGLIAWYLPRYMGPSTKPLVVRQLSSVVVPDYLIPTLGLILVSCPNLIFCNTVSDSRRSRCTDRPVFIPSTPSSPLLTVT